MMKRWSSLLVFAIVIWGALAPLTWVIWQSLAGILNTSESLNYSQLWEMLKFTLLQSFLSSSISIVLGGGLAFYFAGRTVPFRNLIKRISFIPYSFPTVVVAIAFILCFGRSGWIGQWFGDDISLMYNTSAIVAAHVFMNAPLVFTTLLLAIESLPDIYERQAKVLALSNYSRWRYLVWPELRNDIWGLFLTITLICFSSFSIVLILGGSPQLATLEVGIYSAIKSEGDFGKASLLSLLQILLSAPLILLWKRVLSKQKRSVLIPNRPSLLRDQRHDLKSDRFAFFFILGIYMSLIVPPLLSIVVDGFKGISQLGESTQLNILVDAVIGSLKLSLVSSLGSVLSAWFYARFVIDLREKFPTLSNLLQEVPWFMMVFSPALLGIFWLYVSLKLSISVIDLSFGFLMLAHVMMTFPIVYRIIYPPLDRLLVGYHKPIVLLNLSSRVRFLVIEWNELKFSLYAAWGVAVAFSVSEVSTVLLLSGGDYRTLSTLVFELMGSYKFSFAATVALMIGIFSVLWAYFGEGLQARQKGDGIGY